MRDLNVDQIKKLWILDLIIRSGSLKKAAIEAKVSPSAISQNLSSLEKSIGRPLLIRDRGRINATQDAIAILNVVRPAFDAFNRLKALNDSPVPDLAWLNFGTYESLAIDLLPGFIHTMKIKLPQTKLSVRISRTANLLTMVRKGELCAAIVAEVDDFGRFYSEEVCTDRLGVFVSRRHPASELGWRAIDEIGLGSLSPAKDGLPRYFSRYMRQFESRRPLVSSDSFETLRAAAASGSFAAVLPIRVAQRTDELIELSPPKSKGFKESGEHGIFVVSQASCDRQEVDFIASEARRLLGLPHSDRQPQSV